VTYVYSQLNGLPLPVDLGSILLYTDFRKLDSLLYTDMMGERDTVKARGGPIDRCLSQEPRSPLLIQVARCETAAALLAWVPMRMITPYVPPVQHRASLLHAGMGATVRSPGRC
jgi:hypothetical protein